MSLNLVKFLCLSFAVLFQVIGLSEQAIYPYHRAVSKTLTELNLRSLEGHWYGVYHRNSYNETDTCPELDVIAGDGYVNVTESQGNNTLELKRMEQNPHLRGKISQIIDLPAGYSVERPWFVTQIDPVLVVYQVTTGNKSEDNWSVYSRNQTLSRDIVNFGAQRLVEAGAERDSNGNYGYHCL